jgi:enoyl-CoA hydratase/carnithine racemase
MQLEAVDYQEDSGVAVVTLNRPDKHNSFNRRMQAELHGLWRMLRGNDDVRCVLLTGAGDRAFCSGIDLSEALAHVDGGDEPTDPLTFEGVHVGQTGASPLHFDSPLEMIGPKSSGLWKPVIAGINGLACGGAFFMLGEVEFMIAAEHATFFMPYISVGLTSGFDAVQLLHRAPFPEVARMLLMGNDERMSAARAHQIGLVSEVVPGDELRSTALERARTIAQAPLETLVATVRSMWMARDVPRQAALGLAPALMHIGNSTDTIRAGQGAFASGERRRPRIR